MAVSRAEQILTSMINSTPYDQYPQSRLEDLLLQLKEVIEEGGGGGTPAAENVTYDNTESGATAENVQDALDEVFQSVSDGKEDIADAITDKGVPTSASDSFATMAENIAAIPSGAQIIEWYVGAVNQQYSGNWHPHTMQKSGYVTIVYAATTANNHCNIFKNGSSVGTVFFWDDASPWRKCCYIRRLAVNSGDVICMHHNAGVVSTAQAVYLFLFEES